MPVVVDRADILENDLKTALAIIAKAREAQKSADYIKTHVALENTYGLLRLRNLGLAIGFSGKFDIGTYTANIKDVTMSDYTSKSAFLVRLGDTFKVSVQYGVATDVYMNSLVRTLESMGVKASVIKRAYPIFAETEAKE